MKTALTSIGALCAVGQADAATPIAVTSYSTSGVSGSYPDAGGAELTDGFIADRHYPSYPGAGAPYVGWESNPSITLNFATTQTFGSLVVWVDDYHGSFGVTAPASLSAVIGGVTYASFTKGTPLDTGFAYPVGYPGNSAPGGGTPYILSLAGAVGDKIQLSVARGGQWTFISEVQVFTPGAVPEPAIWAMMIGGMGMVGAALRRRRKVAATA